MRETSKSCWSCPPCASGRSVRGAQARIEARRTAPPAVAHAPARHGGAPQRQPDRLPGAAGAGFAPPRTSAEADPEARDLIDSHEIYDPIRDIKDPEHPHTLEQLRVAQQGLITVDDTRGRVHINFTPTIPHCSMATLIGLCIRVKLLRSLPTRFKIDVNVTPGTHASEAAVNKQLNDKERVAAALENDNLLSVVNKCLAGVDADEAS